MEKADEENGEENAEESMEFISSQFSDFQSEFSTWENSSEMVDVGSQDSEMVRVCSENSALVRDLGECPTPVGTQESSQQSEKTGMDSSYSPGNKLFCLLLRIPCVWLYGHRCIRYMGWYV